MADNKELKRYDVLGGFCNFGPSDSGDWVKYEDAFAALSELRAELEASRLECEKMRALLIQVRDSWPNIPDLSGVEGGSAGMAEVEMLRDALKKANSQAEEFERKWYLAGDELEAFQLEREEIRGLFTAAFSAIADPTKEGSHDTMVKIHFFLKRIGAARSAGRSEGGA